MKSMSKKILITGVTGQDGSHMADYLLKNTNHNILGTVRRLSVPNYKNIQHIIDERGTDWLVHLDLTDPHSIDDCVRNYKPDYFINLAAQSFVGLSWNMPVQTFETNTLSVLHVLEAIRKYQPSCRFYNAGSSEEFGDVVSLFQSEDHPLRPRSPYGASKASARLITKVYRESYNLFAVQAWLFNHEGTRRGEEFVTRKISKNVARIFKNYSSEFEPLVLGNLDAKRDWTDAEDCVRAIWEIVNRDVPEDYVIGSGETHSIREFVEEAFNFVNIKGEWTGTGLDERYISSDGKTLVKISADYYRPAEVDFLKANTTKANTHLNWKQTTSFTQLVHKMVKNDCDG